MRQRPGRVWMTWHMKMDSVDNQRRWDSHTVSSCCFLSCLFVCVCLSIFARVNHTHTREHARTQIHVHAGLPRRTRARWARAALITLEQLQWSLWFHIITHEYLTRRTSKIHRSGGQKLEAEIYFRMFKSRDIYRQWMEAMMEKTTAITGGGGWNRFT